MILIRDYVVGDEENIITLLTSILKKYGFSVYLDGIDSDLVDIKKAYLNKRGAFRVLLDNSKIVGFYGVRPFNNGACELKKLYLHEGYQGVGLGELMLKDSFSVASRLGCAYMILETHTKFKKAIRMYKKFGFRICSPYSDNQYCDLAMCKELSR